MSRKRKRKRTNPVFRIYCEGKSEETYINFLRKKFRLPSIKPYKTGHSITQKYIEDSCQGELVIPSDKIFLMYDLDVEGMLEKLKKIKGAIILASNPALEVWYLLHFKNQDASINEEQCIRELEREIDKYKKGEINSKLEEKLNEEMDSAARHAKALFELHEFDNPSSTIFRLIKILKEINNKQYFLKILKFLG